MSPHPPPPPLPPHSPSLSASTSATPSASPTPPTLSTHSLPHPPLTPSPPPLLPLCVQYACVGVWRNGTVDIIANDLGSRSTPVLLSFTDKEVLFGEAAQSQLAVNLKATVHHAKRLLGLPYHHPTVQQLQAHVDYAIVPSEGEDAAAAPRPLVQLLYKGEEVRQSSEELLGLMLSRLKGVADRYSGSDCKEVVLAVPSFFDEQQRVALIGAGQRAGLSVLAVLNEATAACIAFDLDMPQPSRGGKSKESICVIDVGGATSTVTILQSEAGVLTQVASLADLHLGGDDFDSVLVEHFAREFLKQTQLRLQSSHRALARLAVAVEKAKRVLSASTSASIELDGLYEGEDFYSKVSRAKFEALAAPLFKRLSALIASSLQQANLSPVMVDHVCLIGGSSRIPRVTEIVRQVLGGKEPKKGINPEEAVAVGCTVQASLLVGRGKEWEAVKHANEGEKRGEIALAHSLGVEGDDGVVQRVLSKGTTIPTHATFTLAQRRPAPPSSSSSTPLVLRVFEGERALAVDSRLLATLVIPSSVTSLITASLTVDKQRRLHVRAYTGKTIHAELSLDPSTLASHNLTPSPPASADAQALDALYSEKSASRRLLYELLLSLPEPKGVVAAAWEWLEKAKVGVGEEKENEFEKKRAEVEEQVEQWKEEEEKRRANGGSSAEFEDVDDYVANLSLNGHGPSAAQQSSHAEDFEHEIADLD